MDLIILTLKRVFLGVSQAICDISYVLTTVNVQLEDREVEKT